MPIKWTYNDQKRAMKQGWEISLSLCHEEYRLLKYDDDPKDRFRHDAKYFKGVKL